jgi:hypothetical protein
MAPVQDPVEEVSPVEDDVLACPTLREQLTARCYGSVLDFAFIPRVSEAAVSDPTCWGMGAQAVAPVVLKRPSLNLI